LVVVQVALALVLLIGAGLMIRTFRELNTVNPGFSDPATLQTVRIEIPIPTAPGADLVVRRQREILDRLRALPGVTSAAYSGSVPMDGRPDGRDLLVPEGRRFQEGDRPQVRYFKFTAPGFFATLGTPLVAGRDLTWTDVYERRAVVLVSERLARAEWGTPSGALGKRLRGSSTEDQWREIVGVAADIRYEGLGQPAIEAVYIPAAVERMFNLPVFVQRSVVYSVRTPRAGTASLMAEIRKAIWSVDSSLPLSNVQTIGDLSSDSLARTSFTLVMLAIAGAMALVLGIIGIYGVISYAVSQRTREVGIRIALGADAGAVRGMFVRQGLILTSVGVAAGLGGAVALTRWMASLLFGVSPLDPVTYAAVSAVLILAAALASYLPSRRATRVDPIEALRAE
jgi:predicted permease